MKYIVKPGDLMLKVGQRIESITLWTGREIKFVEPVRLIQYTGTEQKTEITVVRYEAKTHAAEV